MYLDLKVIKQEVNYNLGMPSNAKRLWILKYFVQIRTYFPNEWLPINFLKVYDLGSAMLPPFNSPSHSIINKGIWYLKFILMLQL